MTSVLYVEALKRVLPAQYLPAVQSLPQSTLFLLDTVLRFTSGGECPEEAELKTREGWSTSQEEVRKVFDALRPSLVANGGTKRSREVESDEIVDEANSHTTKKLKPDTTTRVPQSPSSEEDAPLYTLHALSLQAPLRRKLDIVIHKRTVRLVNPSSHAVEASIPFGSLKRAFLLNTRGKTKAHWTVAILASDVVAPKLTGKAAAQAAAASNGEAKAEERQIVFGIEAVPTGHATTDHTKAEISRTTHPKGTPSSPQLRAFLEHLPIPFYEPDVSIFRSVAGTDSGGEPIAGVEAYRAAKEGTLWFFNDGILWDGRPCEYWSVSDLVPGSGDDENGGADAVRFVSATGKTGSVFIRRRMPKSAEAEDEEADEEEEYVETAFNPVDAKEQDAILRWAKKRRHVFGISPSESDNADTEGEGGTEAKADVKGKGKAIALPEDDSNDSDDSDFVGESDSEESSATDEDSDNEGEDAEDEAEVSDDEDAEDDEEESMDPKHHPLLREGAVPRMSGAAMKMAIGIVSEDMLGGGSGSRAHRKVAREESVESEEDQEDELDE